MVNLISATPVEHEYYYNSPKLRSLCDLVGQMILDLHDEPLNLDIVFIMNDFDNPNEFSLAFSGTTLSLDFYPDRIEVYDFDEEGGDVLQTFEHDHVNQATLWLVNEANNRNP